MKLKMNFKQTRATLAEDINSPNSLVFLVFELCMLQKYLIFFLSSFFFHFSHNALRKAKDVYNFGLPECKKVKLVYVYLFSIGYYFSLVD